MNQQRKPTKADLKRDWEVLMNEETHTNEAMKIAKSFFKERLEQVRFAAIRLQFTLWRSDEEVQRLRKELEDAIQMGDDLLDQRDDLIAASQNLVDWHRGNFFSRRKMTGKSTLVFELNAIIQKILKEDEDGNFGGSPIPGGEGVGQGVAPGVAEAIPGGDQPDPEGGEIEVSDLPDGGERVQSVPTNPEV